jgi:hypothetical protein
MHPSPGLGFPPIDVTVTDWKEWYTGMDEFDALVMTAASLLSRARARWMPGLNHGLFERAYGSSAHQKRLSYRTSDVVKACGLALWGFDPLILLGKVNIVAR